MVRRAAKIPFSLELITEGKAKIWIPKRANTLPSHLPVFYNPIMELNRDVAVLALQAFQRDLDHKLDVCEPLAGCGVRGVRIALEVEGIGRIFLNDINEKATVLAKKNTKKNDVEKLVNANNLDANSFLSQHARPRGRFDYVDIDPFGSPAPYLDSAVRAVRNKGMIALTATDMAPLCGVHPRACIRKYGGKPLRTEYCHELAVRLLAGCLASTAARHDIGVRIVFCHSTDHYIRVYAVIDYGAQKADNSLKEMGFVLHCFECFHRETVPGIFTRLGRECPEYHGKLSIAGPLWLGKIFDRDFVARMQKELSKKGMRQAKRIGKLLFSAENEADSPATYYVIDKVCDRYGLRAPTTKDVVTQLEKAGYPTVLTHFHRRGIKTVAPARTIKEIITNVAHV